MLTGKFGDALPPKIQLNFNRNTKLFVPKNAFEHRLRNDCHFVQRDELIIAPNKVSGEKS